MSPEWKPGDVAMVRVIEDGEVVRAVREKYAWADPDRAWSFHEVKVLRPLAVIDPEDREEVKRLAFSYATVESARSGDEYRAWDNRSIEARGRIVDSLAAALREFANPRPPRPDEPTGLGAVVEDAAGGHWLRVGSDPGDCWRRAGIRCATDGIDGWTTYADIDAVRVLSEGVQP